MMALSHFTKLNDIRKNKKALFASLSEIEVEILDKVMGGGACYGSSPAKAASGRVLLDAPGRREKDEKVFEGQATLNSMVRAGWLRFASMPGGGGYFWATDSAERVWREMGRTVR